MQLVTTVLLDAGVTTSYDSILDAANAIEPQDGGLADGALDHSQGCKAGGNPVCTSLQIAQRIADSYKDQGVVIVAGENWTIDMIRKRLYYDKRPVMVNYGGDESHYSHSIVIVGVDLDADNGAGRVYYVDSFFSWDNMPLNDFLKQWNRSDIGDPLQVSGYHNWALVVLPAKKED